MAKKKTSLLTFKYRDARGRFVPLSRAKHAYVYRSGRLVEKISFAKIKDSVSNKSREITARASKKVAKKRVTKPKEIKAKKGSRKEKLVKRPTKKDKRKSPPSRKPPKREAKKPAPKISKKVDKKKISRPTPKRYSLEELLSVEKLDHSRRQIRRGKFHGVVGPVTITPYVPETAGYKKTQILKKVKPIGQNKLLQLAILDYELKEPIAITRSTVKGAIAWIKRNFYPHMKRFFMRYGSKAYLFRLVIEREDLRFGNVRHGVGERRFQTISFKSLEEFWDARLLNASTFMKFSKLNYFSHSVDGVIWLMGFTLEVVKSEQEYYVDEPAISYGKKRK